MGRQPTALGVYIFAGGFTVGVQKYFDVLAHFEDGYYGVETAQHNLRDYRGDVLRAFVNPETWLTDSKIKRADFIYGNPPCAPWSSASAGRSLHWTDDPRLNYVKRLFGLVDRMRPTVWAWESVRPAYTKGRPFVDSIVSAAHALGYSATALLVNGANHGVPQTRKRFFLILHKVYLPWRPSGLKKTVTVADAFARPFKTQTHWRSASSPLELALLKKARPGEGLNHVFNRTYPKKVASRKAGENVKGRPCFQRMRLVSDKPSPVLLGIPHKYHPDENRIITVEESAALCGYPRSFVFKGPVSKQYAQVAQAVMPPVGEYLASVVAAGIESKKRISTPFFEEVEIHRDRIETQQLMVIGGGMSLEVKAPFEKIIVPGVVTPSGRTPRPPRQGIGHFIRMRLVDGADTKKILAEVKKKFPQSKAKESDIYWNKRKLEAQGGRP